MLFPAFNQTVWSDTDEKHAGLPGWKAFGLLLGIQAVLDLLVLTESPAVLYPLAVIEALGVWLLLTLVYTMVWVMLTGTFGIDLLRFWLTHTWGGFPLGG